MSFNQWFNNRKAIIDELEQIGKLLESGLLDENSSFGDAKTLLEVAATAEVSKDNILDSLKTIENTLSGSNIQKRAMLDLQKISTRISNSTEPLKEIQKEKQLATQKLEDTLTKAEKSSSFIGKTGSYVLKAIGWIVTRITKLIWQTIKPIADYALRFLYSAVIRDVFKFDRTQAPLVKDILREIMVHTLFTIVAGLFISPVLGTGILGLSASLVGGLVAKAIRNLVAQSFDTQFIRQEPILT